MGIFLNLHSKPFIQASLIAILGITIILLIHFFLSTPPDREWLVAVITQGLYSWASPILGFFNRYKRINYLLKAILAYFLLLILLCILTSLLSTTNLSQMLPFISTFVATTLFFFMAHLIVFLMHFIMKLIDF